MNWLNLRVSVVRSPEYVGSEPVARATWFNVLAYAAEQENGGRIEGARRWKDRQWQQTCGVTMEEVEASSGLLVWDGEDLVVWGYPDEKEAEVKAKREGGREGGKRSAEAKKQAQLEAQLPAGLKGERQRKGKEGEEKGKEQEIRVLHDAFHSRTGYDLQLNPPRRKAWEEFIRRGWGLEQLNRVIHFIQRALSSGDLAFNQQSLTFSVLIEKPEKFEERLQMALNGAGKKPEPAKIMTPQEAMGLS